MVICYSIVIIVSQTPQCCRGFYGTACLPCPENHANPCNGNGQVRRDNTQVSCYNRAVFSVRIELMEMVHVCVMMVLMELRVSCVLNLIGLELTALKVNTSTISIEMLYNSASWHQVSGYQDVLISRSAKGYLN